ncbi:MAG: hypothetical protein M1831_006670 [Alyxoria varia]|nr:MAG: hypothetical protein M1831_006670 [Alyxoria varia]
MRSLHALRGLPPRLSQCSVYAESPSVSSNLHSNAATFRTLLQRQQQSRLYHNLQSRPSQPQLSHLRSTPPTRQLHTRTPLPRLRPQKPRSRLARHSPRRPKTTNAKPQQSSTTPDPTPHLNSPGPSTVAAPSQTLRERFRRLSREYGWTAIGVYLALSALDFPFCLLAVRMLGTDRIGRWERVVVDGFKGILWKGAGMIGVEPPAEESESGLTARGGDAAVRAGETAAAPAAATETGLEKSGVRTGRKQEDEDPHWSWNLKEAEKQAEKKNATWATQLALAYAIHKSFIFLRVPLTAAVLPRTVKTLRSWGWNVGRMPKGKTA